ncbi:class I SAM-dependent methyltransferase [Dyadobacter sp. CY345]|uniref:class I SAM-dependent methyltransferase n=1 Tax=Dyadobacter sp. CY345 TaxID=2909335 RepID=UPI001F32D955|nr:class I SAM-dependent methyltransferase [Dyadobacter sp. CY345]MCF2444077.1 class I SAM-dependent methyltransferase [Dyadobacter sp. CY345]
MKKEWSEEELEEIASQLCNPVGEAGIKTGEFMNLSNANMISRGFELPAINKKDRILEIGPGNGFHVSELVNLTDGIEYCGVDISETMISEAEKINQIWVEKGVVSFTKSDGNILPFSDNYFDKILTVNTIYFWQNPAAYGTEILRVLKPGGVFSLVFSDKNFMQQLPFTKYKFSLYNKDLAHELLRNSGFEVLETVEELETIQNNSGENIKRPIIIILAKK